MMELWVSKAKLKNIKKSLLSGWICKRKTYIIKCRDKEQHFDKPFHKLGTSSYHGLYTILMG